MSTLTTHENLVYQLEELAASDLEMLGHPEIEVFYENEHGEEGSIDICVIELSERALKRIIELEEAVKIISPWLSASLSCHLSKPCEEYKTACNKIFEADK